MNKFFKEYSVTSKLKVRISHPQKLITAYPYIDPIDQFRHVIFDWWVSPYTGVKWLCIMLIDVFRMIENKMATIRIGSMENDALNRHHSENSYMHNSHIL